MRRRAPTAGSGGGAAAGRGAAGFGAAGALAAGVVVRDGGLAGAAPGTICHLAQYGQRTTVAAGSGAWICLLQEVHTSVSATVTIPQQRLPLSSDRGPSPPRPRRCPAATAA